jgi:hypothetical protein
LNSWTVLLREEIADIDFTWQSWLDSESTYRLTVEKSKEAAEGATFARNEYEKWADANKQAKKDLTATLARHATEREALADERGLIKMIMRLIGKAPHLGVCTENQFSDGRFLLLLHPPLHLFRMQAQWHSLGADDGRIASAD